MALFNWIKKKDSTPVQDQKDDKSNKPINDIIIQQWESLLKKSLKDWNRAYTQATDTTINCSKVSLQQIYLRLMDDADIYQAIDKRVSGVLEKPYNIYRGDEITYDYDYLFRSPEFGKIIKGYIESKFYGYTLMQILGRDKNNNISEVDFVSRKHVIPEIHSVLKSEWTREFINYEKNPYVIEVFKDRVGMLNKLIPIWIYKNEAIKAYSIYSEKFGNPLVIGRTTSDNWEDRQRFSTWIKELSTSSSAVINLQDNVEFIESKNGDAYNVYIELIKFCNEEIAKLILGGTMIMDNGSSRSQSEVHQSELQKLIRADINELQWWINNKLNERFRMLGFIKEGDDNITIDFETGEKLQIIDRMKMDMHLISNGYTLDQDYIEDTYSTKIIGKDDRNTII
jgi:hypothetical protein